MHMHSLASITEERLSVKEPRFFVFSSQKFIIIPSRWTSFERTVLLFYFYPIFIPRLDGVRTRITLMGVG